jgi:hypothetical protein
MFVVLPPLVPIIGLPGRRAMEQRLGADRESSAAKLRIMLNQGFQIKKIPQPSNQTTTGGAYFPSPDRGRQTPDPKI